MFDTADFIDRCLEAARHGAAEDVAAVVEQAVSDPDAVRAALGDRVGADFGILHVSDDLVVQRAILPTGYSTGLHEHRLWTVSGVYAGTERHDLYRVVDGDTLEPIGRDDAGPGEVRTLEADVAHSSTSVGTEPLGVFHVYLGNLFATGAGEWDEPTGRRRDFTDDWLHRLIAELDAAGLRTR